MLVSIVPRPAQAVETISGTVRSAANGLALSGIDLDVLDAATGAAVTITGDVTDTSGNYTLTLPGPGTYLVRADPTTAQAVAAQYYNGVFLKSQAQPVVVGSGSAIAGIDFSLPNGVAIGGHVTSAGVGIEAIDIDVYASNGEFLAAYNTSTAAGGIYTIGAFPPGSYFLRADPDITLDTQLYARSYYGGATSLAGATAVPVGTTNVSGIDIALTPGGTIKGVATSAATGAPLAGLDLDVYDVGGARMDVQATTGLVGQYEIGALPTGSYLIRVDPTVAQGFARTYYLSAAAESAATPVAVVAGARTSGINFSVAAGGTLSGTIRAAATNAPVADIDLDLFDSAGSLMPTYTTRSDALGHYQLGPMLPGAYFVRADPSVAQGYAEQLWNGASDLAFATAVNVAASNDAAGVDFHLQAAATITGTVRDAGGTPLVGVDLDLFDATTLTRLRKSALSASDGTYSFETITPGSYVLRADPKPPQVQARQYYDLQPNKTVADTVTVGAGGTASGIDFALPLAGTISGQVFDGSGTPVYNMDLDILVVLGSTAVLMEQNATSDLNGGYTFEQLPPGDYVVRADPDPLVSPPVYYPSATDPSLATLIPLSSGQQITGKNIMLSVTTSSVQTGDQQACLNVMHKDFSKIAKAQASEIAKCAKAGAAGKLSGTIETCMSADPKSKVARAEARARSDFLIRCVPALPDFGVTTIQGVTDAGAPGERDAAHFLFGPNLDGTIVSSSGTTGALSKCQLSVLKGAQRCRATRLSAFADCLKRGTADGTIRFAGALAACLDADTKGKIAKACHSGSGKLDRAVATRCVLGAGELGAAFPGCAAGGPLAECVDAELRCSVCRDLNSVDGLGRDCDVYDDGANDGSCP